MNRDERKASVAPMVLAKESMTTPPTSPKMAPEAMGSTVAPGNETAVTSTYRRKKSPAAVHGWAPVQWARSSMASAPDFQSANTITMIANSRAIRRRPDWIWVMETSWWRGAMTKSRIDLGSESAEGKKDSICRAIGRRVELEPCPQ